MDTIEISSREAILYIALLNAVIGFVLGLIPLLFGYFKRQLKIGVAGIFAATIGGAILGVLLSVPATVIFTWLVIRASKSNGPVQAIEIDSENN